MDTPSLSLADEGLALLQPLGPWPTKVQILLGVDWGEKRLGLALGNLISASARPLCIKEVRNKSDTLAFFAKLINTHQPHAIIMGMPLNELGQIQASALAARKLAQRLHGVYKIPVAFQWEAYTSLAVEKTAKKRPGHSHDDDWAAAAILQSWIDTYEPSQGLRHY